ncbi:Serine/threonine-protein kinase PrkC [Planctomycetes bacterium Poly30]|uniref:Serine/threonine-protein kinase PrkC n=1 Tax=Saltatorellus ferox TaxID=2528018 RepID=A0A518EKH3_9BACT|nr:Serine/threonine-protein kinase PrkC [Planctomycetes bacterium Poly30]
MNPETFEKTLVGHVETVAERDALEELLQHPLLGDLPRAEGYPLLGSYVLFAQLGKGGMANVFRGLHVRLETEVAIKIRTAPPGSSGARFQREASVAAKLEHPNLVRATDVNESHGLQYMVLDYIDGEDADERVARKGPLGAREALTILRDAALGLAEAHRLHFIHRDIKPANVMISREGRVKIADLGLAKSLVDDHLGLTATGGLLGTPMYMAPEQFRRSEETCKASDVYGLGATACFLLTGRHPFDGKSVPEIMQQVCVAGIERLDRSVPALDSQVVDLIESIVALDAAERPADGGELARKITPVLEALGGAVDLADPAAGASKARGVRPPTREMRSRIRAAVAGSASTIGGAPVEDHTDDAGAPAASEPRSILPWVAAAMLLAAAGGIGWSWLRSPNESRTQPVSGPQPRIQGVRAEPDLMAISTLVKNARSRREWSRGYAGLLEHVRKADGPAWLAQLSGPIEELSDEFRRQQRYEKATDLLDPGGQEALIELATTDDLFVPWTEVIAAELAVEFNGLDYVIDESRREQTESLLQKAAVGGDEEAAARAKLLQGVMGLDEFMNGRREDQIGKRVQDDLTEAAERDTDSEAAAWLAVLYLDLLQEARGRDDQLVWFRKGRMIELLQRSLDAETPSADAAYVMGHICSDGLAGVPRSLEEARHYYVLGACKGNVGSISEAILYGASLERRLDADIEEKLLHFANSETEEVATAVRDAYALAALNRAFEGQEKDPERRARALSFLRERVELDLEDKLEKARQFDRVTVFLSAWIEAAGQEGSATRAEVARWIEDHKDMLAKEIYADPLPPRSDPIWAVLLAFDPGLTTEVLVAGAGEEQREGIETFVESGSLLALLETLREDLYEDAPYVLSLFRKAIEVVKAR